MPPDTMQREEGSVISVAEETWKKRFFLHSTKQLTCTLQKYQGHEKQEKIKGTVHSKETKDTCQLGEMCGSRLDPRPIQGILE